MLKYLPQLSKAVETLTSSAMRERALYLQAVDKARADALLPRLAKKVYPRQRPDNEIAKLKSAVQVGWEAVQKVTEQPVASAELEQSAVLALHLMKQSCPVAKECELFKTLLLSLSNNLLTPGGVAALLNGTHYLTKLHAIDSQTTNVLLSSAENNIRRFISSRRYPIDEICACLRFLAETLSLIPRPDTRPLQVLLVSVLEQIEEKLLKAQMPGSDPTAIKSIIDARGLCSVFTAIGVSSSQGLEKLRVLYQIGIKGLPESLPPDQAAEVMEAAALALVGSVEFYDFLISVCLQSPTESASAAFVKRLKQIEISLKVDKPEISASLNESSREYLAFIENLEMPESVRWVNRGDIAGPGEQIRGDRRNFQTDGEKIPSACVQEVLNILRTEFSAPVRKVSVGPYDLEIADQDERVCWIMIHGALNAEQRRMRRHLEGLGWRVLLFDEVKWDKIRDYVPKVETVRKDLIDSRLLVL